MSDLSTNPASVKIGEHPSTPKKSLNNDQTVVEPPKTDTHIKRKKLRFSNSKRVEFAAACGLVIWVFSELMVTHDAPKLTVLWLIIVIFCVPVSYYISQWLNHTLLGHVFFYMIAIGVGIFAYWNSLSPSFSIIPRAQYIETNKTRHFIVCNVNGRVIKCPINVILFAQLTNLREKALAINSYQFEGFTTNNTWEIMPTIDIKMGQTVSFVGTNWGTNGFGIVLGPVKEGDAVRSDYGNEIFPEILNGKTIVPGGTVSGLFFLESPKFGLNGNIRCRIRDSTDKEFLATVSEIQSTNYLRTTLQLGGGEALGIPIQENIKDIPVVVWSEAFPN